jgi:hypothetical protein
LEIRKQKLRRNFKIEQQGLAERFQKIAETTLFENQTNILGKEDEEKALILRLSSETLAEVEQKDIYVRLQEIFRDRKVALDQSLSNIELQYEHIVQETSTELTELETSIQGKTAAVEKLQEEILSMVVKKEMLSKQIEEVNSSHSEKHQALIEQSNDVAEKIREYAIIKNPVVSPSEPVSDSVKPIKGENKSQETKKKAKTAELREVERELEWPVCMDVSRPPIYQCEEGHIICSSCKPLLKVCPHNCGKQYSEPAIRCRFAEKLADRYFRALEECDKST